MSSVALTAGIAAIAAADFGLAFRPEAATLDSPAQRAARELRGKWGFRRDSPARRLCRGVCVASGLSLAIALFITVQELSGRRQRRAASDPVQPLSLVALLGFNVLMNVLMLLMPNCCAWRSVQRIKSNILLPVTGRAATVPQNALAGSVAAPRAVAPAPPAISAPPVLQLAKPLRTGDQLGKTLSIKVHAGGGQAADAFTERLLDRRDSDLMLRGGGGKRDKASACELGQMPGEDEELLDALMHDTIRVLVE